MIKHIAHILYPRLGPDQAEQKVRTHLFVVATGTVFAGVAVAMALQRYYQR